MGKSKYSGSIDAYTLSLFMIIVEKYPVKEKLNRARVCNQMPLSTLFIWSIYEYLFICGNFLDVDRYYLPYLKSLLYTSRKSSLSYGD